MPVMLGDCLQLLKSFEADSLDSLITDPPAGISFMGKEWDSNKGGRDQWVAWMTEVMQECLRVLKPGAHGLVWALPRTSHWTATALENAGFEVRDVVTHLFGTGFPKSLDISKAIDKAAGAKREVVGKAINSYPDSGRKDTHRDGGGKIFDAKEGLHQNLVTAPSTPEAKQWHGWGTALKPASEHWILVRKPCSEKTVAANVLRHGCGGLNIDACRIKIMADDDIHHKNPHTQNKGSKNSCNITLGDGAGDAVPVGRFPSNLILDEAAAEMLDEPSRFFFVHNSLNLCDAKAILEEWKINDANTAKDYSNLSKSAVDSALKFAVTRACPEAELLSVMLNPSMNVKEQELKTLCEAATIPILNLDNVALQELLQGKRTPSKCHVKIAEINALTGIMTIIASRWKLDGSADDATSITIKMNMAVGAKDSANKFAYVAKASKSDRNAGLEGMPLREKGVSGESRVDNTLKGPTNALRPDKPTLSQNHHPTVKSTKLMEYLITLVTPSNGAVLDPFMGSGSTGIAAKRLGFKFVGIEQNQEYFDIATKRIGA